MNDFHPRRPTPFQASRQNLNSPDHTSATDPASPDTMPDQLIVSKPVSVDNQRPADAGQTLPVPDSWITRTEAQERLSLVGIDLDSRRIRHLCARNQLESTKSRNEKNQPQYFINPTSLDQYIAKNRPADQSGTSPYKSDAYPDIVPDEVLERVEKPDPANAGANDFAPDRNAGQMGEGELVPKAQLDQALETIEFLKEEVRDARQLKRDLKTISSEMLETFSRVATHRQLPDNSPQLHRYQTPVEVNERRAGEYVPNASDGV